jgi:hypothetical protein
MQAETTSPVSANDPPRPAPVLPIEPVDRPAWPYETRAVVAGAAFVSVLVVLVWGTVLWRYVQPSAFGGRLTLGPPLSVEFALFVVRPLVHPAVLAGALASWMGRPVARRLLLVGGLGAVAIALEAFVRQNLFHFSRWDGFDVVYNVVDVGARFINTGIPHMLLVVAMTRPGVRSRPASDAPMDALASTDAPPETQATAPTAARPLPYSKTATDDDGQMGRAIVVAAGMDAAASFLRTVVMVWAAAWPSAFQSVGVDWSAMSTPLTAARVASDLAVIAGAAALLARRRWGWRALLAGAAGVLGLRALGWGLAWVYPRTIMRGRAGPDYAVSMVYDTARVGTMAVVYVLLIYVITRPAAKARRWSDA